MEETKINKELLNKFNKVKTAVKNTDFQKKGKANTGKYDFTYLRLEELQPIIDEELLKENLIAFTNFTKDNVIYTVIDLENPDNKIEQTIPMVMKGLQSGSEAQSLGASITYLRRYILLNVYELSIKDNAEMEMDLKSHNLLQIQKRVQLLLSEKMKELGSLDEVAKKLNTNSKKLNETILLYSQLNNFEKALEKVKTDD